MPYKPATSFDEADIVYGMSNSGFYPGLKSVEWDLDNNSINQINFVLEGTYTTQTNRWLDFDSALTPIQGSSQLVYGGHVATNASDGTTDATSWGTISP